VHALNKFDQRTPLHYAAISGSLEAIQLLVDARAQISVSDKDGKLPVDYCSGEAKEYLQQFQSGPDLI